MTGVFVTGTDTGVGKTLVASGLLQVFTDRGVDVRPFKPVETGWPEDADWPRDAACLAHAAGRSDLSREEACPVAYREPLAPAVAARRAGDETGLGTLSDAYNQAAAESQPVLVEGAGGLLVPATESLTMADLAHLWRLPVLVVARAGLGTLNHTALTVHHARRRGLHVLGIVVNRYPENPDVATRTNPDELERLTGVPVLGRLPELPHVDTTEPSLDGLAEAVETHLDLAPILDALDRSQAHAHMPDTSD